MHGVITCRPVTHDSENLKHCTVGPILSHENYATQNIVTVVLCLLMPQWHLSTECQMWRNWPSYTILIRVSTFNHAIRSNGVHQMRVYQSFIHKSRRDLQQWTMVYRSVYLALNCLNCHGVQRPTSPPLSTLADATVASPLATFEILKMPLWHQVSCHCYELHNFHVILVILPESCSSTIKIKISLP